MKIIEALRSSMERVSLPVEEQLWKQVLSYGGVIEHLEDKESRVLLIGTRTDIFLAKLVLDNTLAQVTIIEKSAGVARLAKAEISTLPFPQWGRVNLIEGAFPDEVQVASQQYDLVIAKHVINFYHPDVILKGAMQALKPEGLFFASTPWFARTERQLKDTGINFEKYSLEGFWGGNVFVFRKGDNPQFQL